ncbi:hypothetical protein V6N11_022945 [Hibiscus sabdariffa]|uniref:Uncharacterized protein n=1 Tax=Hibiscus sabdariffa TaxID=183260 RepID=A0ABR2TKS3_9ROSI
MSMRPGCNNRAGSNLSMWLVCENDDSLISQLDHIDPSMKLSSPYSFVNCTTYKYIGMPSKELARILMVSALRFFTGVMTFVMGITTMIKVSRTMWTKVTDAKIASSAPTEQALEDAVSQQKELLAYIEKGRRGFW